MIVIMPFASSATILITNQNSARSIAFGKLSYGCNKNTTRLFSYIEFSSIRSIEYYLLYDIICFFTRICHIGIHRNAIDFIIIDVEFTTRCTIENNGLIIIFFNIQIF